MYPPNSPVTPVNLRPTDPKLGSTTVAGVLPPAPHRVGDHGLDNCVYYVLIPQLLSLDIMHRNFMFKFQLKRVVHRRWVRLLISGIAPA